ncbi:phosphoglycerate kinase [Citromicrobium bathyomarinum]|uniref:phosphoglycerate kinase n=1 Tax=Citromicrobium bathyomarinum TaxID=72174 RepID=UPI00315A4C9B
MSVPQTLDDLGEIAGQIALVRVDFNVPIGNDGAVGDDTRLRASLPTVMALRRRGAVVLLLSHLGRPKGKPNAAFSLAPVAKTYSSLLGDEVHFLEDWTGPGAQRAVSELEAGDVALLENTRFYAGEESNDPELASAMADLADFYVNDAFSASHRAHASTVGVARLLPSYMGRALEDEIGALQSATGLGRRPSTAIIGGAKISSKLNVLEQLSTKVDNLIIGGAMANTFLAALNKPIGRSLAERNLEDAALRIVRNASQGNCQIHLPEDVVVARELTPRPLSLRTALVEGVAADEMILDLGPRTVAKTVDVLRSSQLLIWNGPLGAFETPPFETSTFAIAKAAAELTRKGSLTSLAGGGDTVAALNKSSLAAGLTHVSTGGGAFLEWAADIALPGLQVLT